MTQVDDLPATDAAPTPTDQPLADPTGGSVSADKEAAPEAAPGELDLSVLDRVDPELLRKHPRIAGIVGDISHRQRQAWEADQKATAEQAATLKAETDLRQLAEEDPYEFSKKWLGEREQTRIQHQLDEIRQASAKDLVRSLGRASADLQLTPEDVADLQTRLAGKSDEDVIPVFHQFTADVRARRLHGEWRTKELDKERDAIRKEVAAELLNREPSPDMARARGGTTFDPTRLPPDKFDEWYEKQYPTARRTRAPVTG